MRVLIFLLIIFLNYFTSAQNRSSVWCFGDSAGIDFSSGIPLTFESGVDGRGSCVSLADENGNLLFYAATMRYYASNTEMATFVFDSTHTVMTNGDSIVGRLWYQELVAIPNPANDSTYYLFSISVTDTFGIVYSIVNMKQNGGLGAVTVKNVELQGFGQVDCLNAIKHGNGRDWWIIFRESEFFTGGSNNDWYSYLITPDSIQNYSVQSIGAQNRTNSGRICFSPSGDKLVFTNLLGIIELFYFDRCTGLLSNPVTIELDPGMAPYPFLWSCAFSPDGSKLYVTTNETTSYLYQYDLNAANITASKDTIWLFNLFPYAIGGLKLAPDNKIYLSNVYYTQSVLYYPYADSMYNMYNMNLSVINQPDSLGAACDFQPYSFYLGGKRTYLGLPNNPDYELGPFAGSICDTLTSLNEITEQNAIHIFPNPFFNKIAFQYPQHSKMKIKEATVFNLMGEMVLNKKVTVPLYEVDLSFLQKGVYFISVKTEKNVFTKKIVKL